MDAKVRTRRLEEQGAQHKQTHTNKEVKYEIKKDTKPLKAAEDMQMSFFDLTPDPIIQRLRELDLMEVTPSEAIKILEELKRKL